ncbi:unnamed protein product, partial [Discosporangium mesarthrocarpum]
MRRSGVHIHPKSTPARVTQDKATKQLTLHTEDGAAHPEFDIILMAIGRSPMVGPLNLEAAGVSVGPKGHVLTDDLQNTNVGGVYALGDVVGKVELTPMAIAAGRRLSDRLFGGATTARADYTNVPTVVFSHPVIGTCGLTEPEARKMYGEGNIRIYKSQFTNLFFGPWEIPPEDKQKTAMKVIVTGEEERVVGIHIIGMGADE